ncbi:MAG: alginate lyase [Actinobacteria bacterium]|nr:MAG: alginate lyase [Actinomycetota bacterium]
MTRVRPSLRLVIGGAVSLAVIAAAASLPALAGTAAAATTPQTVILDGAKLAAVKAQLTSSPTSGETKALAALKKSADAALTAGPWSVMDKKSTVSKDKHDYYSLATYYWPNPNTANHCPYIHKDGRWGPTVATTGDLTAWANTWQAISNLTLAWYYTGNSAYAGRAELFLRTWFLNPATKMNPNMNFGQVVPCTTTGRKEGVLEMSQALTQVLDGLAILNTGAPGWAAADQSGMNAWLTAYLKWSTTSSIGVGESKATNNHGTWKDLQDAAIEYYLGQTSAAKTLVSNARSGRIAKQIDSTGKQPMEISRTRPWHYVNYNLQGLIRIAELGKKLNINLWAYTASSGATLAKAVDYLIPYATGTKSWMSSDLDVFNPSYFRDKAHAAATEGGDTKANAAVSKVPSPASGDLWYVEPVAWEILSDPPVQK